MLLIAKLSPRSLVRAGASALFVVATGFAAAPSMAQAEPKPETTSILFVSDRDKPNDYAVYAMNADGSEQTRLSKGEGMYFDPSWSPDHKQILFGKVTVAEKKTRLCLMKADGSDTTVLLTSAEQTLFISPSWSPDGKHIAYSEAHIGSGPDPKATIFVMDPDGKNRVRLADGAVPVWALDSKRILFSPSRSLSGQGIPEIATIDLDGTNIKTVAEKGFGAAWSPDGKRIAYANESDGHPEIFVMDADGSHSKILTKTTGALSIGPLWTADGKHILYTQIPRETSGKTRMEVWLMDADGSNAKAVTKADSFIGSGTSLMFIMHEHTSH